MVGAANDLNITQSGFPAFNSTNGVFAGRTFQAGSGITITNPNGIAGDPTFSVNGSSVVQSLTPDTGGAVTPSGGTIPTLGYQAGVVPTVQTYNDMAGHFRIADQTWETQYVVDASTTPGLKGTFQTIQSAINQAVADGASFSVHKKIYIRFGTYTENLTISAGIYLCGEGFGTTADNLVLSPTIVGTHTIAANTQAYLRGLYFSNTSVSTNTFTSTNTTDSMSVDQCTFNITGSGKHFDLLGEASQFNECTFMQTLYQQAFGMDQGVFFTDCDFLGCGFDNRGILNAVNCTLIANVVCTSGSVNATQCTFTTNTADCISGTGGISILNNCIFNGGISTTVAVSTASGFSGSGNSLSSTSAMGNMYSSPQVFNTMQAGSLMQSVKTAVSLVLPLRSFYVGITSTAAPRTITLPATAALDQIFVIKDESGGAAANNITVTVSGGVKTIDGSTSVLITTNYGCMWVKYDGTNFFII